jgi:hypothetical protein
MAIAGVSEALAASEGAYRSLPYNRRLRPGSVRNREGNFLSHLHGHGGQQPDQTRRVTGCWNMRHSACC